MKLQKHYPYNGIKSCNFLRKNFLGPANWNNENPIPQFKSFYIGRMYNDVPHEILLYPEKTGLKNPIRALRDYVTGLYTFFKV
jgi:hypothetical protein